MDKKITKDKFQTRAGNLFLVTLLSTFVCLFVNSYLPLIITTAILVMYIIYGRIAYKYKAVELEAKEVTEEDIMESLRRLNEDDITNNKNNTDDLIYNPAYSSLNCNIFHK